MKTFNVRLHSSVPKSNQPVQITCDDRAAWRVAMILQHSDPVIAFNDGTDKPAVNPALTKFKVNLFEDEVHMSIIEAIERINTERIEKHGGCYHESFVGGPGEYSPPDCSCERCISAGRSYRYQSFEIPISREMFQYFQTIFCSPSARENNKRRKWGMEHLVPGKALICLYDHQGNMSIRSNKPEIRIGVYVFNHKEKAWRSAP